MDMFDEEETHPTLDQPYSLTKSDMEDLCLARGCGRDGGIACEVQTVVNMLESWRRRI